jgi:hypothetical protein
MHLSTAFPIPMETTLITQSLLITPVSEVSTDHDIIAAMCGHAVMDDSNDETKIGTCELENAWPTVTTRKL